MVKSAINPQLRNAALFAQGEELGKLEILFSQTLKDNPENLDALYGMGLICLKNQQEEDAVPLLEKALKTLPASCPEAVEIHIILAKSYSYLKDFTSLIPHAEYLVEREPGNLAFCADLCRAYLKLGDFECFIPHAKYLLEHDPHNPNIYQDLCYAYRQLGDIESAKQYLRLGVENADRCFQFQPGFPAELTADKQGTIDAVIESKRQCNAHLAGRNCRVALTWAPVSVTENSAELRGTTRNLDDGTTPEFKLWPADSIEGDAPLAVRYEAMPIGECNDEDGVAVWQATVRNLEPGRTYQYRLFPVDNNEVVFGESQFFTAKSLSQAEVFTDTATLNGVGGVVVNGAVGNTTLPTKYFLKYGYRPDNLQSTTTENFAPPPCTGRTKDVVSHALDHVIPYTLEMRYPNVQPAPLNSSDIKPDPEMPSDLAVTITTPFGKDRNHMNGIGVADLVMGWWSLVENPGEPKGDYPGRTVDLSDAEVELTLRCHEFDPRDFYFTACCQKYLDTACSKHMEDTANWCLTGQMTDMRDLSDGNWHSLRYRFRNGSNDWSYCGNNQDEQGEEANRYTYRHIGDVLSKHRGNICFWFVLGNERDTCEGELDVYSIALKYRDGSLLSQGWGARLISWPADSVIDPARLTNGWRGNPDQFWLSGQNPVAPQEFIWDFGKAIEIESVRLHQSTICPAKDLVLSGSMDGNEFESFVNISLPKKEGQEAANSRTFRLLVSAVTLRYLKLGIISGYQADFWGLDAIEVFGDAGPPSPEVAPCSVSEELRDLKPGKTLYYQLVAENEAGTTFGEICSVELPSDARPVLHWAKVLKQEAGKVTLLVRLTAMGHETQLRGWFENQHEEVIEGTSLSAGCQPVPKHMTYVVSCPDKSAQWLGQLVAVNEKGESDKMEVKWEILHQKGLSKKEDGNVSN